MLQLPQQLLSDLASAKYPELLEKKAKTALLRLKADTAADASKAVSAGPLSGRASTQDVLRAMWALVDTSTADDDTAVASSSVSNENAGVR